MNIFSEAACFYVRSGTIGVSHCKKVKVNGITQPFHLFIERRMRAVDPVSIYYCDPTLYKQPRYLIPLGVWEDTSCVVREYRVGEDSYITELNCNKGKNLHYFFPTTEVERRFSKETIWLQSIRR